MASKEVKTPGMLRKRTILAICGILVPIVAIVWWVASPDPEKLLTLDSLTPAQIRVVAVKLLLHPDVKIRAQASAKLIAAGSAALPVLKDIAMHSPDVQLRMTVLSLLTSMDRSGAVEVASELVKDPDWNVRGAAVAAAAQMNGPRAAEVLDTAIKDPEPAIRADAAAAIASSVDPTDGQKSVGSLQVLLKDPDARVRRHAARALHNITGADYSDATAQPRR